MPPETSYAKSGDVYIAYQVLGDGPVDLVYVPGWVSHVELAWELPDLARGFERIGSFSRLILFDKRGTGMSDPVPAGDLPTLEQRMDDVRAVMDAVGSGRAAIFGASEGRYIASCIPDARFVEFPGADHSWWTQDRDALIDEIEAIVTGTRPLPEPDRLLATVLFADLVGSTERLRTVGDRRWAEVLDRF